MSRKWIERAQYLCLVLFLLTLAITLTINARPLYQWDIQHLDILNYTTLSQKELMNNFDHLMRYLNFFWIRTLDMPDFKTSASGALHFYEVKRLFQLNYILLLVTSIPSVRLLHRLNKEKRLWELIQPFQIIAAIPVVFVFLMMTNFNQFFITFHSLFFNNDAWIFDPSKDPIINVLPEGFFLHCFILFFILIEIFYLLPIFVGKRAIKKEP